MLRKRRQLPGSATPGERLCGTAGTEVAQASRPQRRFDPGDRMMLVDDSNLRQHGVY
jgi:hypothetical protein